MSRIRDANLGEVQLELQDTGKVAGAADDETTRELVEGRSRNGSGVKARGMGKKLEQPQEYSQHSTY